MANRYVGTPLNAEWDAIQRRRAVNKALLEQAMNTPGGTEYVRGGRVGPTQAVPYSWGTGAGQIGKALIAGLSDKKAREREATLEDQYSSEQKGASERVMAALEGQGNAGQYGPQIPVEPNRDKAAVMMANDPYLQNNDVAKALINSGAYGGRGRSGYSKTFEGADGRIYSMDMRNPNAQPRLLAGEGGEPLYSPKYTPGALYDQNRAKQLGTGSAELETDPATASAVEAANQGRIGALPQTQAQEAADKKQAEAEQKRAFTMEGANDLVARAETILSGEGTDKPTGSFIGAALDFTGSLVGIDIPGSIPAERLKTIGAALTSKTPRFEGPQGVYDVSLYEKMAGSVGNSKITPEKRQAAVEEFKAAFAKYEEVEPGVFVDKTKGTTGLSAEKEARFRKRLEQERGQ